MKFYIVTLFLILLLLNIYDIYSTNVLLKLGVEELNPMMNYAINYLGNLLGLIVYKGVFFILLAFLCFQATMRKYLTKQEAILLLLGLIILVTCYSYVMYTYNYQLMLELY